MKRTDLIQSELIEGFALSPQQRSLWSLRQAGGHQYCRAKLWAEIEGLVGIDTFKDALARTVRRHEILRTRFRSLPGMAAPLQVVVDLELALIEVDLSSREEGVQWQELQRLYDEADRWEFDLANGPVLFCVLVRFTSQKHYLLLAMPALCTDDSSLKRLIQEIGRAYAALLEEQEPLDGAMQYVDFSAWQNEILASPDSQPLTNYWLKRPWRSFRDGFLAARQELRQNMSRPESFRTSWDSRLAARMAEFCRNDGIDVAVFLTSCFHLLLRRLTGSSETLVGVCCEGRHYDDLRDVIGPLARYLPIGCSFSGDTKIDEIFEGVKQAIREATDRQEYFCREAVMTDATGQDLDLCYGFHFRLPAGRQRAGDITLTIFRKQVRSERFKLKVSFEEGYAGDLMAEFDFDSGALALAEVKAIAGQYRVLVESVLEDFRRPVGQLEILSREERERILFAWNDTGEHYPAKECAPVHVLFEQQAERTPGKVAVVYRDRHLSYQELNQRANKLARRLRHLGVDREVLVGICLERSFDMMVGLLGILKAGGAYVPLDISYPPERLAFILNDAQIKILLADDRAGEIAAGWTGTILRFDIDYPSSGGADNLECSATLDNLAYVMYTSGSTGQPKGVMLCHRGLINYVKWSARAYEVVEGSGTLMHSSYGFDLTITALFPPLIVGQKVILVPEGDDMQEMEAFRQWKDLSLIKITPSHLALLEHLISTEQAPAMARRFIIGGEALNWGDLDYWLANAPGTRITNEYGPTETVVGCCVYQLVSGEKGKGAIPIGRPVANTQIYILDESLEVLPAGMRGGIYISGEGLARGYQGRADLTGERFIPNPYGREPGLRMYWTGDIGRYLQDGNIEFLGRVDDQVKLRGFRIELGEIEDALARHPRVRQSVVVVRQSERGDKSLVAYVVARNGAVTVDELRDYLRRKLPEYMVPSFIVVLETVPLTSNGKVDRKSLPEPERAVANYEPPATPTEELVAGIWKQVLQLERVGVNQNFFALGGHSLLATQVMSRLRKVFDVQLPMRSLFEAPTLAGLSHKVEEARRSRDGFKTPPLLRTARRVDLPLSFAQERLWFLDQLEPGSAAHNIYRPIRIRGELKIEALQQSINEIIRRHEVLRTTFEMSQGKPVQVIHPGKEEALQVIQIGGSEEDRERRVKELVEKEAQQPFDLRKGPLLRVKLVKLADSEHVLLFTLHHIIADGWSMGVLVKEFVHLYQRFSTGRSTPAAELPIQYVDYAVWQRTWLSGEVLEQQLSYWKGRLAGAPARLELPTDRPRPLTSSYVGAVKVFVLSGKVSEGLRRLSQRAGVTLFMTLLAGFKVLLHRYSGQNDIVVGTPIANRNHRETEGLIGFFVNTLALRTDMSGDPTFMELLNREREVALGAYGHQDMPFERLVQELQPERALSQNPLFQVLLVLQNTPAEPLRIEGLAFDAVVCEHRTAKFDLTLTWEETEEGVSGAFEYNIDLFDRSTIERMVVHLERLLEETITDPGKRLSELRMLSDAETEQLLVEWNDTGTEHRLSKCIHELFEEQAEGTPAGVALESQDCQLTYAELNRRANLLAHHLTHLGVESETVVGVFMARSIEMIVALLGILKAGGVYFPLDPAFPLGRLSQMIDELQPPIILTQAGLREQLPVFYGQTICLDIDSNLLGGEDGPNPVCLSTPDNLAYVMHTSGSTGVPKAIGIPHRAVVRLVRDTNYVLLNRTETLVQMAPLSFDASTFEIWGALLNGARLVVLPPGLLLMEDLGDMLQKHRVTTVWLTASLFHQMVDQNLAGLAYVRQLLAGGDVLSPTHCRKFLAESRGGRLINGYGPTEGTTFTCCHVMTEVLDAEDPVSIGRPIGKTRVFVLDEALNLVAIGVPGELYIGGAGLGRGYVQRGDLTAEKFLPDPFCREGGGRLYRTGDLVRYLPDGRLQFIGRVDHQVKIRGFRIEPAEIEAVLRSHSAVLDAVVVAWQETGGDKHLVGYVATGPGAAGQDSAKDIRSYLQTKLPEYMVPPTILILEQLPLTRNGKVDRKVLPAPDGNRETLAKPLILPQTETEELLAGVWAELLKIEQIGVTENFFELGGHSLLATQVISRTRELFAVEVPLRDLFEAPTIARLAARIEEACRQGAGMQSPFVRIRETKEPPPLSFAQERLWFIHQLQPDSTAYNMPWAMRIGGRLKLWVLEAVINEVLRRHEVLRTTFEMAGGGPVQVIHDHEPRYLPIADLSGLDAAAREKEAIELIRWESERPFNLRLDLVMRIALLRLGEEDHVVLYTMHHIASDGWSMGVLNREVELLYAAFASGRPSPLPELPVQYADFAVWQRNWLRGEVFQKQLDYWTKRLSGLDPLQLPADHSRPPMQTFAGEQYRLRIDRELSAALKDLGHREGATLFMTLLAAVNVLLSRYTGQEDIAIGAAIANRNRAEIEQLIGFFVNTLIVRTDLSGEPTVSELLQRVREEILGAYTHQDLPFEKLVEELQPERDLSRNPLFQVMFALQNAPDEGMALEGLTRLEIGGAETRTRFDLEMHFFERKEGLVCLMIHNRDLFRKETIIKMGRHLEFLLSQFVANPRQRISELALLSEVERQILISEWSNAATAYPRNASIHELFEEQASLWPEAAAVTLGNRSLSYRELDQRSNQTARRLRRAGVRPGMLVGICMERSLHMIVGLLGILKAGAAYVSLDLGLPRERLGGMLEDLELRVILSDADLREDLPLKEAANGCSQSQVICMDAAWSVIEGEQTKALECSAGGESLAYVSFTSGSTGRPKGVCVPHRAVVRLVRNANYATFSNQDVFLQLAPIWFDASVLEVWGCLLNGGRLVVFPPETPSLIELGRILQTERVTTLWLTSGLFSQMVDEAPEGLKNLRQLLAGGDVLSPMHVKKALSLLTDGQLINGYGPTENTTFTACYRIPRGYSGGRSVPIGQAVANTQCYVLDRQLTPVPLGIPGELCAAGDGLAWGYLKQPQLTAERFVPNPFGNGSRLYRTGDLVRLLEDGNFEFIRRMDNQVKVRGHRIELGEIECVLGRHPVVERNVVVLREDRPGDRRLVAYIVVARDAASRVISAETKEQHGRQWEALFDDTYAESGDQGDPAFNVKGWNSSYTNAPLPNEEMREWLDDTLDGIRSTGACRLLEIGCGTGLLLFRLEKHCQMYWATDFSKQALAYIDRQLAYRPEGSRPKLLHRMADNFEGMKTGQFDGVILNSVVQYFPDLDYLEKVVEGALRVIDKGCIFLGDVKSLPMLETYHASLQLHKARKELLLTQLRQRIEAQMRLENELLVAPGFFMALPKRFPRIQHVEIRPKRGRAVNELTRFRYQVILHVGSAPELLRIERWVDWSDEPKTIADIHTLLLTQPERIGIRGLANKRVWAETQVLKHLEHPAGDQAEDLREALRGQQASGVEPDELYAIAEEVGYRVEISWARHAADGRYDVAFWRPANGDRYAKVLFADNTVEDHRRSEHGNNPVSGLVLRQIVPQLRSYLQERLPEYMLPSAFVTVETLPLTRNGKVDWRRLPVPEPERGGIDQAYVGPRTVAEQKLAAIWADVLAIESIGIHDNFFEIGGHSLLATQIVSRVRQVFELELPLRNVFEHPTIAALTASIEAARERPQMSSMPPLVKLARGREAQLSFAQERLWFIDQLQPNSNGYNMPGAVRIAGPFQIEAMERAINEIIRRHEVLRTTYKISPAGPLQVVHEHCWRPLAQVDLSALPADRRSAEAVRLIKEERERPFDLEKGPVVRTTLLRDGPHEHVVLYTMHHIASDGWSLQVLNHEIHSLYEAFSKGRPSPLAELPIQYADFAEWQRSWLQGETLDSQLEFWKEQLAGVVPLELLTDRPRPAMQSFDAAVQSIRIPAEVGKRLKELSQREGVTLFMTLVAGLQGLFSRHSGQDDIVIGTPIANRNHAEIEPLIGFFVNTLVLRSDLSGDPSVSELLQRVRKVTLSAYAHQDLPFEKLVEALQPQRDLSRNPLVQVMLQLFNLSYRDNERNADAISPLRDGQRLTTRFDLEVYFRESKEGLTGWVLYNSELFSSGTIARLAEHLERVLSGFADDPAKRLSELPLVSEAEQNRLLFEWNNTERIYAHDKCIHKLFEEQVERTPDQPAVVCQGEQLTYQDLNTRANQVAHYLRKRGVGPEVRVGICMEPCLEMVIGLLGILKAGGVYVPLDRTYPKERLSFMLEDTAISVLVTDSHYDKSQLPICMLCSVCLDDEREAIAREDRDRLDAGVCAEDLAYIIYTSGSTGVPKGVAVPHRAVVRLVRHSNYVQFSPDDIFLQLAPISFDASTFEIWGCLLNGARLVIMRPRIPSLEELGRTIRHEGITTLWLTAGLFHQMVDNGLDDLKSVRQLLAGGDVLSVPHVLRALRELRGCQLINGYGPTENTTFTCYYHVPADWAGGRSVPIGRPISNTRIYVLDPNLAPVPIGVPGELYVAGDGLARGYLKRPRQTAERFVPNLFGQGAAGERLYKTGDLVRWLPEGNLEFLRRLDQQVKIRGFRIELGEIEAVLLRHSAVRAAAVVTDGEQTDTRQLCAYIVFHPEKRCDFAMVRNFLRERLPAYMLPSDFVELDQLPLLANGKVDRHRLPPPQREGLSGVEVFVPPRNATEEKLALIWRDVLQRKQIGVYDNFFDMGGHSLLATQVTSRVREVFGVELPLRHLFESPTIVCLAEMIDWVAQKRKTTSNTTTAREAGTI